MGAFFNGILCPTRSWAGRKVILANTRFATLGLFLSTSAIMQKAGKSGISADKQSEI